MEPGPELDARVAIEIMEFTSADAYKPSQDGPLRFIEGVWRSWSPSTSISDAMEVVEKMERDGWGHQHLRYSTGATDGGRVIRWVFMQPGHGHLSMSKAEADTLPYAISLCALKAVGKEAARREAAAYRRGVEAGAKWGAEQMRKGSRISENFRHGYSESCTIVVDETPTEITARAVKELCDA